MKRMMLFLCILSILSGAAFAADIAKVSAVPENDLTGWQTIDEVPGVIYRFHPQNMHLMEIRTKIPLMTKKGVLWRAGEGENKFATDQARDLYGKLNKIAAISGVTINYRSVVINKYLLDLWPEFFQEIIAALKTINKNS